MAVSKPKLLDSYDKIRVHEGFPLNYYEIVGHDLSDRDKEIVTKLSEVLLRKTGVTAVTFKNLTPNETAVFINKVKSELDKLPRDLFDRLLTFDEKEILKGEFEAFLINLSLVVDPKSAAEFLTEHVSVYGVLSPLIWDGQLEEILYNKTTEPVYVYHRIHGLCETNIFIKEVSEAKALVKRVSNFVGRTISKEIPLLDAHLPDGSRFNATIPPASPQGVSITIRKFTRQSFTIVDLLRLSTISTDAAAFLWVATEGFRIHPMNIIVCGNAGAGKTTTLDALSSFVPDRERIITVEDTLELHLGDRKNWIQLQALPAYRGEGGVTMDVLVQNSLRMRPDRILVGEVRGHEAQTLFTAMNIGNRGSMGTLHANSARDVIIRLTNEPMNVPESMIPLMDLVVVQHRLHIRGKGMIRRVVEIAEVARMEKVALNTLYSWNPINDTLEKQNVPSQMVEKLSVFAGLSKNEVTDEIEVRRRLLEWLAKKDFKDRKRIRDVFQRYYVDPEGVLRDAGLL